MPRVGDWVLAIGNPFGLGGTVTAGIVSAEGRDIGSGPYDQFIQIDAPINKGNSGGPTFNLKGEVVGVNTAIFSPSGGSVGLGFAIPAAHRRRGRRRTGARRRASAAISACRSSRVTQEIADGLGLKNSDGALVAETQPDTPAAAAGLKSGDVIVKFNNEAVKSAGDLTRKVGAMKPGEKAQVTYIRNGEEKTADVTLGVAARGEKTAASADHERRAEQERADARACSSRRRERARASRSSTSIPTGKAASKGITAGDVILEVAGKPVSSPREVKSEIEAAKKRRQEGRADAGQDRASLALRRLRVPEGVNGQVADDAPGLVPGVYAVAGAPVPPPQNRRCSVLVHICALARCGRDRRSRLQSTTCQLLPKTLPASAL